MPPRSARRLGVLSTALLLATALLAPTVASAAPAGTAATFGERGSAFGDVPVRAASTTPIEVRDLSFSCPSGRVPASGFTDVRPGSTFARTIDCLVWYEITRGRTATTYDPEGAVNRQQMAVFIHRMLDDLILLPEPPSRSQFRDVPATGEAGEAINTLASDELAEMLGVRIVAGKSATSFAPKEKVTRAQMGSFIARTLEGVFHATGVSIIDRGRCDNVFRDEARIPSPHLTNVKLLCAAGVVAGRTDGTYGPAADVNRGQMSAFLMRLMDIFVEVKVTIPPDAYADIHVDRGADATACNDTGRDGSLGKPFCTIQAGIAKARTLSGFAVAVHVRDRAHAYAEDVVLSSGSAFTIDLIPARDELVPLNGSVRIDGDEAVDFNVVWGFDVISPSLPAFDVRTTGSAIIVESVADAPVGVRLNQDGRTAILGSMIHADTVGVDIAGTVLRTDGQGSGLFANAFGGVSDAYVLAPSGTGSAIAANLAEWAEDNEFSTPVTIGQHGGRQAIVPAP